jgi:GNAT superfamily N-acetyltransferase
MASNKGLFSLKTADLNNQKDLEAIARMEIAINLELRPRFKFDFSNRTAFNKVVEGLRSGEKDKKIIMAYAGNDVAGYLKSFMNNYLNIVDYRLLFVYPQFRKLGVGSDLLKRGEEEAREKGYGLIETYASIPVRPFYRKNGFVKVSSEEWDERMVKKLK